jgi:tRNA/rRNA methyltransferase
VLVEPAGALNVGSIARVMKNMGLHRLILVNPQCDRLSDEARQMAVHAIDVLEAAEEVPTLLDALHDCQRTVATTGRNQTTLNITLEHPRSALPWLLDPVLDPVRYPSNPSAAIGEAALIFGREDRGLSNEELNYAQRHIFIPTSPVYPSMNLAQAVAICCYELYGLLETQVHSQAQEEPSDQAMSLFSSATPILPGEAMIDLAPQNALEGLYQHLEAVLLKIGYLYPHTATSRMETFRRLFNRAYLSEREVKMLRGILRQMEWAAQREEAGQ